MSTSRQLIRAAWLWALLYSGIHLLAELLQRALGLPRVLLPAATILYTILLVAYCIRHDLHSKIGLHAHALPLQGWLYALPLGLPVIINLLQGGLHAAPWMSYAALACACICEEIFFRGFLVAALQKHHKLLIMLATSALFALYHLVNMLHAAPAYVLLQVIFAFSVGMAYSAYVIRWGSILPCILFHLLTNVSSAAPRTPGSADVLLYGLCSAVCVAYSLYLSFCKRMDLRRPQA